MASAPCNVQRRHSKLGPSKRGPRTTVRAPWPLSPPRKRKVPAAVSYRYTITIMCLQQASGAAGARGPRATDPWTRHSTGKCCDRGPVAGRRGAGWPVALGRAGCGSSDSQGGGERAVGLGAWGLVDGSWSLLLGPRTSVLRWQAVGQSPGLMSHARTVYRPDLNAPPEAVRLQMRQSSL